MGREKQSINVLNGVGFSMSMTMAYSSHGKSLSTGYLQTSGDLDV